MQRLHLQTVAECQMETWRHEAIARPYWRLYWNQTPGWSVHVDERTFTLEPGQVLLVAPETIYATSWKRSSRHFYIHFTYQDESGRPLPDIHVLPCDAVLRHLLTLARSRNHFHAGALVLHALACLPASAWQQAASSPMVLAAQHLGRRYLHRLVGNDELARVAGMHVNAFIRRFRTETGETPRHWHLRERIDAACLALDGDATVEEVSERFGFCDRHHFTRVFTRVRGIPPAAYRLSAARVVASNNKGKATKAAKTR
jgi:AraC-like DNA-binding protein